MKKKMIRCLIFDFDGVIVDSEPYWAEADRRIIKDEGKQLLPEAKRAVIGLRQDLAMRTLLDMHGINADPHVLNVKRIRLMEEYYRYQVPLFEGAVEVLNQLSAEGYALAVASSTPLNLVQISLERHNLRYLFSHVVSGDGVEHGKPAPDIFLRVLELMSLEAESVLVIEDSLPGIIGATAARIRTVWVRNKDASGAMEHATYVIDLLHELPALVSRIGWKTHPKK